MSVAASVSGETNIDVDTVQMCVCRPQDCVFLYWEKTAKLFQPELGEYCASFREACGNITESSQKL